MIGAGGIGRWALATPATALLAFVLSRGSAAPVPRHGGDVARLRLSWSARPERIESCRALSAAELATRAEHMRQRVVCDGRSATYLLEVSADDVRLGASVVQGAGLRHDRPMFLLREFDVAPGARRVRVSFTRRERTDGDAAAFAAIETTDADTGIFAGRAQREAAEHARRAEAAIPPRLAVDTTVTFAPGQVVVVTFDQESRTLRLLREAPRPPR